MGNLFGYIRLRIIRVVPVPVILLQKQWTHPQFSLPLLGLIDSDISYGVRLPFRTLIAEVIIIPFSGLLMRLLSLV